MIKVAPSILSADYVNLQKDIEKVEAAGADLLIVVFVIVLSGGMGRAISPVSGATIICGGASNRDVVEITKRTMVPVLCGFVMTIVLALISL